MTETGGAEAGGAETGGAEAGGAEAGAAAVLPLLGESLALDAVNSRYGIAPDVIDFLDDTRISGWVDGLATVHQLSADAFEPGDASSLRGVRDAATTIVVATMDRTRPPTRAIAIVNEAARLAPTLLALGWGPAGPARSTRPAGTDAPPLAGRLAVATIELVAGPDAVRVRRCARPGCSMLFVQHHGHRRFCHPSCSHLVRQERYRHRV